MEATVAEDAKTLQRLGGKKSYTIQDIAIKGTVPVNPILGFTLSSVLEFQFGKLGVFVI